MGARSAVLGTADGVRWFDDSEQEISSYLHRGTVLSATDGGALVGHAQMFEAEQRAAQPNRCPHGMELKSLAVATSIAGTSSGGDLVEAGSSTPAAKARD
jgi:hypothetical protein